MALRDGSHRDHEEFEAMPRVDMPVIVGESNPYGGDPYYALYPFPEGCAGWRLCTLVLGMRRTHYLGSFERVNLCVGKWRLGEARVNAVAVAFNRGRLVLCGSKVCSAFGLDFEPYTVRDLRVFGPDSEKDYRAVVLPHPSGLCRLWNEEGAFEKARNAVAELCPELNQLFGVVDAEG